MHTPEPAQPSGTAPPSPVAPRAFDKTRKTLYWIAAVDSWKKSASAVKSRASFPMLRALIRREKATAVEALEAYSVEQLGRAMQVHTLLLVLLTPILLWTLVTLTKGIAALIRFQTITTWLLYSAPVCVFLAAKLYISYRSRQAITDELRRRPERFWQQQKEGGATE